MVYEVISLILGIIKIYLYKLLNWNKISFKSIPKMNSTFKIAIKNKSRLVIGKCFRSRSNVNFRIYNEGIVTIGKNCFFNDNCSINCQKEITIGDNLICGQNVMFFDHDHDYKNNIDNYIREKILIGNNVWIGANCTILKGVCIGDNVVIGTGTVIRENIPSNTLVYQEKKIITKKIKEGK